MLNALEDFGSENLTEIANEINNSGVIPGDLSTSIFIIWKWQKCGSYDECCAYFGQLTRRMTMFFFEQTLRDIC